MQWHEITKYSPEGYHDREYTIDEWTSFYDIGKSFNGIVFTFQEYQTVERRHIDVVSQLLSETNCHFLTIEYIEIYKDSLIHDLKKSPYNEEYLNVCCDVSTSRLREIVSSNGLYLDARG